MPGLLSRTEIQNVPQVGRKTRRPQHRFEVRQSPWAIQPFCLAPVLPGDTLENLLLQARVVSDPVKNPLIGWWAEFYFFYVPHRAMAGSGSFQAMMLDPSATAGNASAGTDNALYEFAGGVNWVTQCREAVVKWFFRDEGESVIAGTINGQPSAQIAQESWLDSLMTKTRFDTEYATADVPVVDSADANTTLDASEVEKAMRTYEFLRQNRLTDQTYEDYLRTNGVRIPDQEKEHKPELIRYVREWTYPTNTVNPADGKPSSALSWSIAERADKKRFFKEPGFIFGCMVTRPKVYLSKQTGAAAGLLDNVFGWLPAVLADDPYTSLKLVNQGQGPIPTMVDTGGYVVDLRDLYLYGDQFFGGFGTLLTDADKGLIGLPATDGKKRYAVDADVTALFVNGATNFKTVRADGVVALNILSKVVDNTATTFT